MDKCKPYESEVTKSFIERVRKAKKTTLEKLKEMNEFKFEKCDPIVKKRDKKYISKFGFRGNLISKRCPTGRIMETSATLDAKKQRTVMKFLKTDEVSMMGFKA